MLHRLTLLLTLFAATEPPLPEPGRAGDRFSQASGVAAHGMGTQGGDGDEPVRTCVVSAATPTPSPTVAAAGDRCFGDCRDDGVVTVDEIILLVRRALAIAPADVCPLPDRGARVPSVSDLVRAVRNLLRGCPAAPVPTPTAILAGDDSLIPGRVLRIEFTTNPPFVESLPNTLYAFLGRADRVEAYGTMTGSLYDGDALLGLSASSVGCCGTGEYSFFPAPVTWKSPGSPWDHPAGDPAVVDFTSLHDGSIAGRIDIAIDSGRLDIDLDAVALVFIHATFSNGGSTIPPAPLLTSVGIIGGPPGDPTPTVGGEPTVVPSPTPHPGDDDDDCAAAVAPPNDAAPVTL